MRQIFFLLFAVLITLSVSATARGLLKDGEKIRGVNLGGWLMLEPWIRPSLFDQFLNSSLQDTAIDETSFNQVLGVVEATRQLEKHWEEWVTEDDFQKISDYGLNLVRLPFGWWHVKTTALYASGILNFLPIRRKII